MARRDRSRCVCRRRIIPHSTCLHEVADRHGMLGSPTWVSSRRIITVGRCLCGAVSFEVDLPVQSCVNCHCESCRWQSSAPITTFIGVSDEQWRWTGKRPKIYNSSPGIERTFCPNCGSPISFRSQRMSGAMHFYVCSMEQPEALSPTLHVAIEEKLSWLKLADDLPSHVGPDYTKGP